MSKTIDLLFLLTLGSSIFPVLFHFRGAIHRANRIRKLVKEFNLKAAWREFGQDGLFAYKSDYSWKQKKMYRHLRVEHDNKKKQAMRRWIAIYRLNHISWLHYMKFEFVILGVLVLLSAMNFVVKKFS